MKWPSVLIAAVLVWTLWAEQDSIVSGEPPTMWSSGWQPVDVFEQRAACEAAARAAAARHGVVQRLPRFSIPSWMEPYRPSRWVWLARRGTVQVALTCLPRPPR